MSDAPHEWRAGSARRSLGAIAGLAWLALIASGVAAGSVLAQEAPATILAGVYTVEQADRGGALYASACERCHEATEFVGAEFRSKWHGRPVRDLYILVRTTMPDDDPNTLAPQQYSDLLAYLLRANGYPAGDEELPGSPGPLSRIGFVVLP